jgi:hypothetical protein
MIVYKDYITFIILGDEVNLISNETSYGRSTVAEINNKYYYLDDEVPLISTALFAWQELNNKQLNSEELHQVMVDNNLISEAV